MSRQNVYYKIFDAEDTKDAVLAIPCGDFRHAIFYLATDGGDDANFTVKFQGSIGKGIDANMDVAPDFSAAQSVTNMWDYIEVVDLEDGSMIDGDTGVSSAGGDDYRMFEANINGLQYIGARLTARSAGEVTLVLRLFND